MDHMYLTDNTGRWRVFNSLRKWREIAVLDYESSALPAELPRRASLVAIDILFTLTNSITMSDLRDVVHPVRNAARIESRFGLGNADDLEILLCRRMWTCKSQAAWH